MRKALCLATIKKGTKCRISVENLGDRCAKHKGIKIQKFYGFYTRPNSFIESNTLDRNKPNQKTLKETAYSFSHNGVDFIISNDGLILVSSNEINEKIFEFKKSFISNTNLGNWKLNEYAWDNYLKLLNTLNLLLECAQRTVPKMSYHLFQYYHISRNDLVRITYENGIPKRQTCYGGDSVASLMRMNLIEDKEIERTFKDRPFAPKSIFIEFEKYVKRIQLNEESMRPLNDLARILGMFHEEDYRGSFLLGWIFIEEFFIGKWREFLDSKNYEIKVGEKRISKNRKKILEGRDYSISIILNQLELNDQINYPHFKTYDELRKVRNKIIHNSFRPNLKNAQEMIEAIRPLFEKTVGFDLKFHGTRYGSTGL